MNVLLAVLLAAMATSDSQALFDKLKTLEGIWRAKSTKGWEDTTTVKVIAAGSTVMSTSFDAHPGETMATMYTLDGDRVVLTHYCVAKNQPRLVATSFDRETNTATFEYLDATGIRSRDQGHMDKVVMQFLPDGTYKSRWTWFSNGSERWLEEIQYFREDGKAK